jgi:hypothetical protein
MNGHMNVKVRKNNNKWSLMHVAISVGYLQVFLERNAV